MTSYQMPIDRETKEDSISENIIEGNNSQMVIHGKDGPYLMDKHKWPKLNLPLEKGIIGGDPTEVLTQED